jgi:hypothetical protein
LRCVWPPFSEFNTENTERSTEVTEKSSRRRIDKYISRVANCARFPFSTFYGLRFRRGGHF